MLATVKVALDVVVGTVCCQQAAHRLECFAQQPDLVLCGLCSGDPCSRAAHGVISGLEICYVLLHISQLVQESPVRIIIWTMRCQVAAPIMCACGVLFCVDIHFTVLRNVLILADPGGLTYF
jgi:hypothetical protein